MVKQAFFVALLFSMAPTAQAAAVFTFSNSQPATLPACQGAPAAAFAFLLTNNTASLQYINTYDFTLNGTGGSGDLDSANLYFYEDLNSNGVVDAGDVPHAMFAIGGMLSFDTFGAALPIPAGSGRRYIISLAFIPAAPLGSTYQVVPLSLDAGTDTAGLSEGYVAFSNTATSPMLTLSSCSGSATSTRTGTMTMTSTPSPTPRSTPTATATPSDPATRTRTPSAPTVTASITGSSTGTGTLTSSSTKTPTPAAPISSPTGSPTVTPSVTSGLSDSATRTATDTASPTGTSTPTPAPDAIDTVSTSVADPSIGRGPNEVLAAVPVPQPDPRYLTVHLAGACDKVQVCLYTYSMACLAKVDGPGALTPGWVQVRLPAEFDRVANGIYYFSAQSFRSGQGSLTVKSGTLLVLR